MRIQVYHKHREPFTWQWLLWRTETVSCAQLRVRILIKYQIQRKKAPSERGSVRFWSNSKFNEGMQIITHLNFTPGIGGALLSQLNVAAGVDVQGNHTGSLNRHLYFGACLMSWIRYLVRRLFSDGSPNAHQVNRPMLRLLQRNPILQQESLHTKTLLSDPILQQESFTLWFCK